MHARHALIAVLIAVLLFVVLAQLRAAHTIDAQLKEFITEDTVIVRGRLSLLEWLWYATARHRLAQLRVVNDEFLPPGKALLIGGPAQNRQARNLWPARPTRAGLFLLDRTALVDGEYLIISDFAGYAPATRSPLNRVLAVLAGLALLALSGPRFPWPRTPRWSIALAALVFASALMLAYGLSLTIGIVSLLLFAALARRHVTFWHWGAAVLLLTAAIGFPIGAPLRTRRLPPGLFSAGVLLAAVLLLLQAAFFSLVLRLAALALLHFLFGLADRRRAAALLLLVTLALALALL